MSIRATHTYALVEVSAATYREIAEKLRAAGYDHAFHESGAIDMHGLAITPELFGSGPDVIVAAQEKTIAPPDSDSADWRDRQPRSLKRMQMVCGCEEGAHEPTQNMTSSPGYRVCALGWPIR